VSVIKQNPIISEGENGEKIFSYKFNVPSNDYNTSGNYLTLLQANQTLVFESVDYINYIIEWLDYDDLITGDISFFKIIKEFRFSQNKTDYSPWLMLTKENLKSIGVNEKISIQFRYTALPFQENYNDNIQIKKPDNLGWYNVVTYNSNTPYIFDKDYPNGGSLDWVIGWGTNGEFHINTETSKIYQKENGAWSGGVYFERSTSGTAGVSYLPTHFKNYELTDSFINDINSKSGIVPINDFILSSDLRFGKTFESSLDSQSYRPQKGDMMFLNPLLQGINLQGYEEIKSIYNYPILPENYEPRIYIKQLDLFTKQWVNVVSNEPLFCLNNVGDEVIFKPPFTLKLYSIESFSVEVDGICSTSWNPCLKIEMRYSFNSRYWDTKWMPLTLTNLKCIKPNPLKFFYIEFKFTKICDNNGEPICVSDIVVNGNIQNVSQDYDKINRFGLRSDCNYGNNTNSNGIGNGDGSDGNILNNYDPSTGQCIISSDCDSNNIIPHDWSADLQSCGTQYGTFNPYNSKQTLALNEKIAGDVSNMFGWEVDYYKTEADDAGVDYVLHEYGTYNTVSKQKLKILVPDNKFPEDQIGFNMFNMALFDSFEIHITKSEFYSKFGVGTRPGQKDFIFICQINKFFEVEHAQSYRDFMNSSIYFKVTLTKKQDDTIIDNGSYTTDFNDMVKNNQLDNLFGLDVKEDIKHVVNDPLLQNLTEINATDTKFKYDDNVEILVNAGVDKEEILDFKKPDPIQLKVAVPSIEANLENGQTIISQNYYDLTSKNGDVAIQYQRLDNDICDCCNRAFSIWFSISKYVSGMVYNLIDNYNSTINQGYKIDFIDGNLVINYFGQIYTIDIAISPNKWYALVVNFNQKQGKIEVYLYKRKGLCDTNDLELLDEAYYPLTPVAYSGDLVLKLKGSYLYVTNIRLWSEILPKNEHSKILSQYIVKNTEYLIMGDSCDKVVLTPHHKF
jgi:hypothetical protein